jgi:hypothetical protein
MNLTSIIQMVVINNDKSESKSSSYYCVWNDVNWMYSRSGATFKL